MAGNTQDKRVNDQRVRGLKSGETLNESMLGRGTGAILFKKVGAVTTAYFRWSLNKKPGQLSIGQYRSIPSSPGLGLSEIREKARHLSDILVNHGNPKEYLAKAAAASKAHSKAEAEAAEAESKQGTFQDLLDHYASDLKARGKVKAKEVARIFQMRVSEPHPRIAAKLARDVTSGDIFHILVTLEDSGPRKRGKNNTTPAPQSDMHSSSDTLRRYLQAAFQKALTSHWSLEHRSSEPTKQFGLENNPAKNVSSYQNLYCGDTESLEQSEMRVLLQYLDGLPERHRALALAPIYLGGQRHQMLAALRWENVEKDGIMLFDKKGKGATRPHFLPFTPRIIEIMKPLLELRLSPIGPFALSEKPITGGNLSKFYSTAGTKLSAEENESDIRTRKFSWKNVRVATESMLAGIGISGQTRAHLLSHGRAGVQSKHYDRNAYYSEKIEALTAWGMFLDDLREGKLRTDIKLLSIRELRENTLSG